MISENSLEYAKSHKDFFIKSMIGTKKAASSKVAIFMAGSPGAGKTEVATALSEMYPDYVVIDADWFRAQFPDYRGDNSSDFQKAASWLVEQAFKFVIVNGYNFILDATFALISSNENIKRAIKGGYSSSIFYVYQNPYIAWKFTKQREKIEGRVVPKTAFINAYFKSRENIIKAKEKYPEVQLNLVIKDFGNNISEVQFDTENVALILPEMYSLKELEDNLDD